MKQQLALIRISLIVIAILTIIETYFLFLKPDLIRIIFFCITIFGFLLVVIFYVIGVMEVGKIIFEIEQDNYLIRLVEYDDYQKVRILLNEKELSNSEDEVLLLEEYEKITIDLVRTDHHYLVLKENNSIMIFHAKVTKKNVDISFKNECEEIEEIKELLKQKANLVGKQINFLN